MEKNIDKGKENIIAMTPIIDLMRKRWRLQHQICT